MTSFLAVLIAVFLSNNGDIRATSTTLSSEILVHTDQVERVTLSEEIHTFSHIEDNHDQSSHYKTAQSTIYDDNSIDHYYQQFELSGSTLWKYDNAMVGFFQDTVSELIDRSDSSFKGHVNALTRNALLRSSFNYLLLDPRKTSNLPTSGQDESQKWKVFLSSIFYVGKGTRSRPYAHLYEVSNKK